MPNPTTPKLQAVRERFALLLWAYLEHVLVRLVLAHFGRVHVHVRQRWLGHVVAVQPAELRLYKQHEAEQEASREPANVACAHQERISSVSRLGTAFEMGIILFEWKHAGYPLQI